MLYLIQAQPRNPTPHSTPRISSLSDSSTSNNATKRIRKLVLLTRLCSWSRCPIPETQPGTYLPWSPRSGTDQKGCVENEELLSLAQARADAEEAYGVRLQELAKNATRKGGFTRDDGAGARKAFDGMRKEMEEVPTPCQCDSDGISLAKIMSKWLKISMQW